MVVRTLRFQRTSFISQCIDRIQKGGFSGRIEPEEYADGNRKAKREDDGKGCNDCWPLGETGDRRRTGNSEKDANDAAQKAEHQCLDEKLRQDIAAPGAYGQPAAALAVPFRPRYQ